MHSCWNLTDSLHSSPPRPFFLAGVHRVFCRAVLLRRVLEAIHEKSSMNHLREWTIECNPSTVSTEKAKLFRECGVNRISMGVQALDDELLETIGRVHSLKAALESYAKLRAADFDNINLDLMFGLPGQTLDHWRNTLKRAIELQPEHLSTYCLILEEDTEFWSLFQKGLIKPNEDQELAMYQIAMDMLASAGYQLFEMSNFAKLGRKCAHNLAYWEGRDYVGLGPSACSTVGNRRWQNVPDTDRYIEGIRSEKPITISEEAITPKLRASERAAFGMRMNAGVPAELVRGRWDKEITELLSAELVQWRNGRLKPTSRGILFADEVATRFV